MNTLDNFPISGSEWFRTALVMRMLAEGAFRPSGNGRLAGLSRPAKAIVRYVMNRMVIVLDCPLCRIPRAASLRLFGSGNVNIPQPLHVSSS